MHGKRMKVTNSVSIRHISITSKFINKVVNNGVTIILSIVANLVCVLQKMNFVHFSKAWKYIKTLEWK